MKLRLGALWAVLTLTTTGVEGAAAQSTDAFVLPFGMFRLSVEGVHESYESTFDANGNRVPLAGGLAGDLTPSRFAALRPLATQLDAFFASTTGVPVDASALSLGALDAQAAATQTQGIARLAVGILPRLEIGASLPLDRSARTVQRLGLSGGSVGVNPAPAANGEIMARIGWGPLGSSALLPTADSPAGIELLSRVDALAGEPLQLPAAAADIELLQTLLVNEYGLPLLDSRLDPYRLGDAEVDARLLLLSTFGAAPFPGNTLAPHLRVAVSGGLRLATGTQPDSLPLLAPLAMEGLSSFFVGGTGDVFLGSRLWLTGGARYERARASEITWRFAPADSLLSVLDPPAPASLQPGSRLEITLAPRFRLVESIWLGAMYTAAQVEDAELTAAGGEATVLTLEGGQLQQIGLGIRYGSLAAYWDGRASLPAEINLTYRRTVSGPEGAPAAGAVVVSASLLPQLWARRGGSR